MNSGRSMGRIVWINSFEKSGLHPFNPQRAIDNDLTNKLSNSIPNPTNRYNTSNKILTSQNEIFQITRYEFGQHIQNINQLPPITIAMINNRVSEGIFAQKPII